MKLLRSTSAAALAALLGTTMFVSSSLADDEATESRDVDEFTRIVIEGAMDLIIEVGGTQSVEITTVRDYISRVETHVEEDTLYISQEGRWRNREIDIEITVRSLDAITLEGAADIDVTGIDSDMFELEIDGAGDITLEGSCNTVEIEINGAGDVDAEDLKCKRVYVTINGAGDVDAYASESVEAELNGVGDITICGDPSSVRPRIHGLGSFEVSDCD